MRAEAPIFTHDHALKIFGPAGSGKTRELVRILREHVDAGDFVLGEGIIVSFTRAAAWDIARRVNPDGEPGRYHCTLHALCRRYYGFDNEIAETRLKEFFAAHGIGFASGRSADPDEWMMEPDSERSEGALIYTFWSLCRNRLITIAEGKLRWMPEPEVAQWWYDNRLERLFADYVEWKAEENLSDFNDLLEWAAWNPPKASWPFLVLDEAQDCTPLQWQAVNAFAGRCEVAYIAGDDDQAIYQWAGASPHEFLFAQTATEDVLHVNHRSGAAIVDAAQSFIRRNRVRREKDIVPARDGGRVDDTRGEVPLPAFDESTFVMARAHYLNVPLMEELTVRGYPFVDRRGRYGVNGSAASAYRRYTQLRSGQRVTLDEVRLFVDGIPSRGPWLSRGAKQGLKRLDKDQRESTYVRLPQLVDYGATEELVNAVTAGDVSMLTRVDQARLGYLRSVEQAHGQEWLDEKKAARLCQVGTIHSFKGLEAQRAIVNTGMPMRAVKEAVSDPEPERRVFYVAMTRAAERVTFYSAGPSLTPYTGVL